MLELGIPGGDNIDPRCRLTSGTVIHLYGEYFSSELDDDWHNANHNR